MNSEKNEIFKRLFRIILTTVFLLVVVPICMDRENDIAYAMEIANRVNKRVVLEKVKALDFNNAAPITDDNALKFLEPGEYKIKNLTGESTNYSFGLKINKDSTLPLQFLRIKINDNEVIDLIDYKCNEDDENEYYCLDSDFIVEEKDIDIFMWLSEETDNTAQGKKLIYSIFASENSNNI